MKKHGAIGYDDKVKSNRLTGVVRLTTSSSQAKLELLPYKDRDGKAVNPKFKNGTPELRVALEDLPTNPRVAPNDKSGKLYRVRMSPDGLDVENLGPVNTKVKAILVDVSREGGVDGVPSSYEKENTYNPDEPLYEFWLSYKITEGYFKNVIIPAYRLRDIFEENSAEPGFAKFKGNPDNPKATQIRRTVKWGDIYGIWDDPIEWPDDGNVIPELFDRAMAADLIVDVTINEAGYPSEIGLQEAYDSYDEPKGKSKKPAAKPKKPAKKEVPAKKKSRKEDF